MQRWKYLNLKMERITHKSILRLLFAIRARVRVCFGVRAKQPRRSIKNIYLSSESRPFGQFTRFTAEIV